MKVHRDIRITQVQTTHCYICVTVYLTNALNKQSNFLSQRPARIRYLGFATLHRDADTPCGHSQIFQPSFWQSMSLAHTSSKIVAQQPCYKHAPISFTFLAPTVIELSTCIKSSKCSLFKNTSIFGVGLLCRLKVFAMRQASWEDFFEMGK
jgi:hypothetical protein